MICSRGKSIFTSQHLLLPPPVKHSSSDLTTKQRCKRRFRSTFCRKSKNIGQVGAQDKSQFNPNRSICLDQSSLVDVEVLRDTGNGMGVVAAHSQPQDPC